MSPYPIEIFDDPLGYLRYRAGGDTVSMNIRRTIPDEVPVGRFEGIRQVVDALVPRAEYLDRIWREVRGSPEGGRLTLMTRGVCTSWSP